MDMKNDREWLLRKAEQEDGDFVSVGGLVSSLDNAPQPAKNVIPMKHAFARFVQFSRRERKLSLEQFAQKVDVDLAELLEIEKDEQYIPALRTVYQIATFLNVPKQKLMALAGLLTPKDASFQSAALKFAARSEPVETLSKSEHAALEEYVKFLCEQ